jgi:hypothetical protein
VTKKLCFWRKKTKKLQHLCSWCTFSPHRFQVTSVSLEHFYLKKTFFHFKECDSFLEKNYLKSVGVRSLTAALNFFFLPKKRHYSTSRCMISMADNSVADALPFSHETSTRLETYVCTSNWLWKTSCYSNTAAAALFPICWRMQIFLCLPIRKFNVVTLVRLGNRGSWVRE